LYFPDLGAKSHLSLNKGHHPKLFIRHSQRVYRRITILVAAVFVSFDVIYLKKETMARRGSSMFAPANGAPISLGADFEDDYDSEDDEKVVAAAAAAAVPKLPPVNNPCAPGGRPMVGGFAAAAYEAAKAHHYVSVTFVLRLLLFVDSCIFEFYPCLFQLQLTPVFLIA
jgi:hypothetical protein